MNKLLTTNNGGFPFALDDLRWEQDAVRDAFYGLLTTWGITEADSYVLNGCVTVDGGTTWDITAGYVVLEGEIYKVDAQSLTKLFGSVPVFFVSELNDPAGLKTFENAVSHNVYKIRRAVIINEATPTTKLEALTAATIHEKIAEKTAPKVSEQISNLITAVITDADTKTNIPSTLWAVELQTNTALRSFKYTVINKTIHLDFVILGSYFNANSVGGIVLKLPNNLICNGIYTGSGNFYNTNIFTPPAGEVESTGIMVSTASSVFFNTPGDALIMVPSKAATEVFALNGAQNINVRGSITFNID